MSVKHDTMLAIEVPPDLDQGSYAEFLRELEEALMRRPKGITLDCSLLEKASPGHVSTLWNAQNRCVLAGIPVHLSSVGAGLRRILMTLDLHDYLVAENENADSEQQDDPSHDADEHPPQLQLKFRPTIADISRTLNGLHGFLADMKVSELEAFELETAFYEIATNIRLHSKISANSTAQLTVCLVGNRITLKFIDLGPRFDPTARIEPLDVSRAISRRQRRGFGLEMVRRLVDVVHYSRENGQFNVLYLKKELSPGKEVHRND